MPILPDRDVEKRVSIKALPAICHPHWHRAESPRITPCFCNIPTRPTFWEDLFPMQTRLSTSPSSRLSVIAFFSVGRDCHACFC